mmetsp:Transcript_73247/g.214760  ORF Transcript_73247/g.214760 Transcript_73247/m.214760 type:complete len:293 (-) Transcript_73247:580-1458(-)
MAALLEVLLQHRQQVVVLLQLLLQLSLLLDLFKDPIGEVGVTIGNGIKLLVGPGLLLPERVHAVAQAVALLDDDLQLHLDVVVLAELGLLLLDEARLLLALQVVGLGDGAHALLQRLDLDVKLLLLRLQEHDLLAHARPIQALRLPQLHAFQLLLRGLARLLEFQALLLEPLDLLLEPGLRVDLAGARVRQALELGPQLRQRRVGLRLLRPRQQPRPERLHLAPELQGPALRVRRHALALVELRRALREERALREDLLLQLRQLLLMPLANLHLLLQLLLQVPEAALQLARG